MAPAFASAEGPRAWVLVSATPVNSLESGTTTVPYTSHGGPLGPYTRTFATTFVSGRFSYDLSFEFVRSPEWKPRDGLSAMQTPSKVAGRGGADFSWTVPPPTIPMDGSLAFSVTMTERPQELTVEPQGASTAWLPMNIPKEPSRVAFVNARTSAEMTGLTAATPGTQSLTLKPPAQTAQPWEITVSVSAFGNASIVYRYEWGGAAVPPGKLPCELARLAFGLPPTPTGMRFDGADLRRQFDDAITRYEQESKTRAFVGDTGRGTLGAMAWLANQGGLTDDLNKSFVLTTDADRSAIEQGKYRDDAVPWGTERRLYLEIAAEAGRAKRKLTPGEVFYLALKQRDGDAKEACLLAHNTLRTLARVSVNPITGKGDLDYTMLQHDEKFIETYLEPLIDQPPLGAGQNTGAWYHTFGVAYFEMQARGQQASTNELSAAFGGGTLDELNLALNEIVQISDDATRSEADRRSALSRLANEVEQVARKRLFGSPDDPLKYCYNIWGAEVGSWLYEERLRVASPQSFVVPSPIPRSPWGTGMVASMIRTTRELGRQGAARLRSTAWRIRMFFSGSPVDITWSGSGHTMRLDQRSQNLYGSYPVHLLPYWEPKSRSWGALWVDVGDEPAEISFEAVADGVHHLVVTDGAGGEPRIYTVGVRKGDRYALTAGPGGATELLRPGGAAIPQLAPGAAAAPPSAPSPRPAVPPAPTSGWDPGPVELGPVVDATGRLTSEQILDVRHAVLTLSLDAGVDLAVVFVPPVSREAAAAECGRWRQHLIEKGVLPAESALLLYGGDGRGYSRAPEVDAHLPLAIIKQAWEETAHEQELPARVAAQLRRIRELR